MRCYICDWSPTGDVSFYNETLELNHFLNSPIMAGTGRIPGGLYNNNRLIYLDNQTPVCANCYHSGKTAGSSWNFAEDPPEQDPDTLSLDELEELE
jgi:hypothetical protein